MFTGGIEAEVESVYDYAYEEEIIRKKSILSNEGKLGYRHCKYSKAEMG